jgi:hypothetical protein
LDPISREAGIAAPSLLTLLADGGGRTAALALLHQRALQVTGGRCSLLYEQQPATGRMQATSGTGLDELPVDGWQPSGGEAAIVAQAFAGRAPLLVAAVAEQMPLLFGHLRTDCAILLPLVTEAGRVGVLAIGTSGAAPDGVDALGLSDVPAGFVVALELSRLRQREEFEGDIREVLDAFAGRLATLRDLAAALEPLCVASTRLFAADRTTVWLYDRDARSLRPLASSDPAFSSGAEPVRADDPIAPAAIALRTVCAGLASNRTTATSILTVPLHGWRRALGTIVFEGVRVEPGDDITLLGRADEVGRHVSSAVEAMQLVSTVTHGDQPVRRRRPPGRARSRRA